MSVWKEIREKSIGTSVRKEDLPPIDPAAEQKRKEDTARWYARQEEKRKHKEETLKMINISSGVGAALAGILLLFSSSEFTPGLLLFAPIISLVVFIISRFILEDIYLYEINEW